MSLLLQKDYALDKAAINISYFSVSKNYSLWREVLLLLRKIRVPIPVKRQDSNTTYFLIKYKFAQGKVQQHILQNRDVNISASDNIEMIFVPPQHKSL